MPKMLKFDMADERHVGKYILGHNSTLELQDIYPKLKPPCIVIRIK